MPNQLQLIEQSLAYGRQAATRAGRSLNEEAFRLGALKDLASEGMYNSIFVNPDRFSRESDVFSKPYFVDNTPAPVIPMPTAPQPVQSQQSAPVESNLVSLVQKRLGVNSTLSGPLKPSLSGAGGYSGGASTRRRTLSNLSSSKEDNKTLTKIS